MVFSAAIAPRARAKVHPAPNEKPREGQGVLIFKEPRTGSAWLGAVLSAFSDMTFAGEAVQWPDCHAFPSEEISAYIDVLVTKPDVVKLESFRDRRDALRALLVAGEASKKSSWKIFPRPGGPKHVAFGGFAAVPENFGATAAQKRSAWDAEAGLASETTPPRRAAQDAAGACGAVDFPTVLRRAHAKVVVYVRTNVVAWAFARLRGRGELRRLLSSADKTPGTNDCDGHNTCTAARPVVAEIARAVGDLERSLDYRHDLATTQFLYSLVMTYERLRVDLGGELTRLRHFLGLKPGVLPPHNVSASAAFATSLFESSSASAPTLATPAFAEKTTARGVLSLGAPPPSNASIAALLDAVDAALAAPARADDPEHAALAACLRAMLTAVEPTDFFYAVAAPDSNATRCMPAFAHDGTPTGLRRGVVDRMYARFVDDDETSSPGWHRDAGDLRVDDDGGAPIGGPLPYYGTGRRRRRRRRR